MKAAISAGLLLMGSTLAARNLACTSVVLITSTAALATPEANAAPVLPEIPTTAEAGLPGLVSTARHQFRGVLICCPRRSIESHRAEAASGRRVSAIAKIFTLPSRKGGPPAAIFPKKTGDVIKKNNIVVD